MHPLRAWRVQKTASTTEQSEGTAGSGAGPRGLSGCGKQFPCGARDPGGEGRRASQRHRDWVGCTHSQAGGHKAGVLDPGPWEQESGLGSHESRPCRSSGCRTSGVLGAGLASCPTARLSQPPSWHTPALPLRPVGRPNWCTLPSENRAASRDEVLERPDPSSDPAALPDSHGGPGPIPGPDATHSRADVCSEAQRPCSPAPVPLHHDPPHVLNKCYLSPPWARALAQPLAALKWDVEGTNSRQQQALTQRGLPSRS